MASKSLSRLNDDHKITSIGHRFKATAIKQSLNGNKLNWILQLDQNRVVNHLKHCSMMSTISKPDQLSAEMWVRGFTILPFGETENERIRSILLWHCWNKYVRGRKVRFSDIHKKCVFFGHLICKSKRNAGEFDHNRLKKKSNVQFLSFFSPTLSVCVLLGSKKCENGEISGNSYS